MPTPEQLNLHAAPCPHSPPQSLAASGNPTSECRGQDSPTCWFLLKPPQSQLDPSLISQKAFGRREEPQTHDTRSPPSPPRLSILLRDSNKRQPDRTCASCSGQTSWEEQRSQEWDTQKPPPSSQNTREYLKVTRQQESWKPTAGNTCYMSLPVWKDTKTRGKEEERASLVSKVTQRKPPKPKSGVTIQNRGRTLPTTADR